MLPLSEQVELAAKAGYDAIEPWLNDLHTHRERGGSLADVAKRIADLGMTVESAIGFAEWIVDDPEKRARGLETAKRDMEAVRELGGTRIAAPPAGATKGDRLDLFSAAERYRTLLELGESLGVVPQLELWGFSTNLSRLGELALVAVECGHPAACVLPDVYHIYKGGSDFSGLRLLNGHRVHVFHMNDYPAEPAREQISDADRVYPGDGVAPLGAILADLRAGGFQGTLSLELFNRTYWQQDPLEVAKRGLESMRTAVEKSAG